MAHLPVRLKEGTILGGLYVIGGVLGEGSSGVVYDAVRIEGDEPVALKLLHADLAGDKQLRARFVRESVILRRLEGAHICPLLDSGELPDPRRPTSALLYMALARIPGKGLDKILAEEKFLDVPRACTIGLGICYALSEAHAQGAIHRDLKPANVIIRPDDSVVAVDFGLAKIVTGEGTGTTAITHHNMIFGTPEYMAPEQARGEELDARCDIYSAGVVLYELLTGHVPFAAATPLAVLTAHMTMEVVSPRKREKCEHIPESLEKVVLRALEKDPSNRFATAAILADALSPFAAGGDRPSRAKRTEPSEGDLSSKNDQTTAHDTRKTIPDVGEQSVLAVVAASSTPVSKPNSETQNGASAPSSLLRPPMRVLVGLLIVGLLLGLGLVWIRMLR